jgi:hypothetical protein
VHILGILYEIRKAPFVEIINKFLPLIYAFLDDVLNFGIMDLHIVLLKKYEFRGNCYNQSHTLLGGVNEVSLCFYIFLPTSVKFSIENLQVIPLSRCEFSEFGGVKVIFYTYEHK